MNCLLALAALFLARSCNGFTETVPTKRSTASRSVQHSSNAQNAARTPMISSRQMQPRIRHASQCSKNPTQLYASAAAAADIVELKCTEYTKPEATSASPAANRKPPVIIVHGLLGQSRNFASIAQSLAAQLQFKRRILTVDLRNHGESGHAESMSYTAQAQDLLAVMDREGMEEAVLIGHSMGGKVVKAAALLHPERVTGLVVMDIARELCLEVSCIIRIRIRIISHQFPKSPFTNKSPFLSGQIREP